MNLVDEELEYIIFFVGESIYCNELGVWRLPLSEELLIRFRLTIRLCGEGAVEQDIIDVFRVFLTVWHCMVIDYVG